MCRELSLAASKARAGWRGMGSEWRSGGGTAKRTPSCAAVLPVPNRTTPHSPAVPAPLQAKWQAIFTLCDDDGNGRLTAPELAHKLSDLGLPMADDGARSWARSSAQRPALCGDGGACPVPPF